MHPSLIPGPVYPQTWYADSVDIGPGYPALDSDISTEVCIVGAGLAGLSVGYELAKRGVSVVILEAGRVAWGASGRNGGFVAPGYALDTGAIIDKVGIDCGKRLYRYSQLGVQRLRQNIEAFSSRSFMGEGALVVSRHPDTANAQAEVRQSQDNFGEQVALWSRDRIREVLDTRRYFDGVYNPHGFHIHPLRYALDLATEFKRLGGQLYENSPARYREESQKSANNSGLSPSQKIAAGTGSVRAGQVIICTSGYDQGFYKPVSRSVLPVATHVAVTAPLDNTLKNLVRTEASIADTRCACDYYRMIEQDRLLWGGKISTLRAPPGALDDIMRKAMAEVYPALAAVQIDYSWSGIVGYCQHKMPVIRKTGQQTWVATAFGGHGLNTTAMAGDLVASAIADNDQRWQDFDPFGLHWGGGPLGQWAVQGSYWWMQVKDRTVEAVAQYR